MNSYFSLNIDSLLGMLTNCSPEWKVSRLESKTPLLLGGLKTSFESLTVFSCFIYHLNILAEVSLFPQALMIHLLINSGLSNCPVSSLLSSVSRLLAGSGYVRLSRLQSDLLRAGDLLVRAGFILGLRSEHYQLGYILQQIVTDCLRLRNLHFLPWESSQKKDSWF